MRLRSDNLNFPVLNNNDGRKERRDRYCGNDLCQIVERCNLFAAYSILKSRDLYTINYMIRCVLNLFVILQYISFECAS